MLKNVRFWLMISLLAFALPAFAVACGDLEDDECDPAESATCTCTLDEGGTCNDPAEEGCECTDSASDDTGTGTGTSTETETETGTTPTGYSFVMVEDTRNNPSGDYPGADLDAISVTTGGVEHFATAVEDSEINAAGNSAIDTNNVLGAPEGKCENFTGDTFVSLGGAGNYIIVGFNDDTETVTFDSGDTIHVYEIGQAECPGSNSDDDPYDVKVSVGTDVGSFTQVGTGGVGSNIITIP